MAVLGGAALVFGALVVTQARNRRGSPGPSSPFGIEGP
jgi:hypothetical protein